MKIERHRDRVRRPNTDASEEVPAPNGSGSDSADESAENGPLTNGQADLSDEQSNAVADSGNGYSYLEDAEGNGHASETESSSVVLVLPRRKRRVTHTPVPPEPIVAPAPAASITEPVSEVVAPPAEQVVAPPPLPGIALPPKARRRTDIPAPPARPVVAATVAETPSASEPTTGVGRWQVRITLEGVLWFSFFALAIVTRLWDLSNRGIHHDESLHAVYGNNLYSGAGYIHDPMMHGPLQFHLIAFMYWLFGTNEMTARMASAFCGIWVVMAPFFLRRQMGKVPALIASFLLLVSPSVLYFSRMAREDAIFSAMEMLMIVGLWRFVSTRRPADFFIFAAGLSLMFTIKEAAYLTVAVLAVFFALLFIVQSGYAIMAAAGAYGLTMGALLLFMRSNMQERDASNAIIPNSGTIPPLPNIPEVSPNYDTISYFITALVTHPLVLGAAFLTIAFIASVIILFRRERSRLNAPTRVISTRPRTRVIASARSDSSSTLQTRVSRGNGAVAAKTVEPAQPTKDVVETPRVATTQPDVDPDAATEVWDPRRLDPKPGTLLARYQPGSMPHLVGSLFARPSVLLIGFIIAAAIYTVLYTVFFTDIPRGLLSGIFGSLGYWMAQHGVERGSQPWYYYFLLIPLYEPIAVFFSLAGTIFFSWRGVRWLRRKRAESREFSDAPRLGAFNLDRPVPLAEFQPFLAAFLVWWLFGVTFIYSWAGEKMPWLMVHMVRPAVLLASLFLGALLLSMIARRRERVEAAAAYAERRATYAGGTPSLSTAGMVRSTLARFAQPGLQMAGATAGSSTSLDLSGRQVMAMSRGGQSPRSRPAAHTSSRSRQTSRSNIPVPPRRGGYGRGAAVAVVRRQEPPWLSWNLPASNFPVLSFLTLFVLFAISWAMTMNYQIALNNSYASWTWTWVWPALMFALVLSFVGWLGPSRALRYLAIGLFSVFFLYQFRSAMMLSYFQPDVPKEMAVYVQTAPDVTRTMKEIEDFSKATVASSGKLDVKVQYDSDVSWPFSWYFHDFKNAQFIGSAEPQPGADVSIMVFGYDTKNGNTELPKNYVSQRYAMRWWFPEDWYKRDLMKGIPEGQTYRTIPFLTSSSTLLIKLGDTFTKPDNQATLWKYLFFREPPQPLGSYDMLVYVRKDVAPFYHYLQYQPNPSDDIP